MVVHTNNLSYLGVRKAEIGRTTVSGQPGQKVQETSLSTNKSWTGCHVLGHSSFERGINRKLSV
jgi:hypothetical protein